MDQSINTPLCLLEDSGVLGGGLGVQQGVLGDVLGAPQVLDVDGVQQGVLGDVLGAPQVLDVDGVQQGVLGNTGLTLRQPSRTRVSEILTILLTSEGHQNMN